MSSPISKSDALSLLHKAQAESVPVELVATGPGQQAMYVLGLVAIENEDGEILSIQVPGQIAVFFEVENAEFEYTDPREASPEQRSMEQQLLNFTISIKKSEWEIFIRVWKRPNGVTVH